MMAGILGGCVHYWTNFDHGVGLEGFLRRCGLMVVVMVMMSAMVMMMREVVPVVVWS